MALLPHEYQDAIGRRHGSEVQRYCLDRYQQ
jgi:hypothetical protein